MRLFARADGMVYVVQQGSRLVAVHGDTLAPANVQSDALAVALAVEHARNRGIDATHARLIELASHDQWSVPNNLDAHRPLYRVALGDADGTELYMSSITGEIVRDTTRRERAWNAVGSVVHWIYPTLLRRNWAAWDATVWWLSLVACIGALTGAILGVLRLRLRERRFTSPYRGWHAWHHWLGITCVLFVVTWIVSGWLSMDHGRLFSTGRLDAREVRALAPEALGTQFSGPLGLRGVSGNVVEVEWFRFARREYRRDGSPESQSLFPDSRSTLDSHRYIDPHEVTLWTRRISPDCGAAAPVDGHDAYPMQSIVPGAPVYRVVCGDAWYHVDGANGAVLEKLDPSRRAYRWAYSALHTLDFPALVRRPRLRTLLVVGLCALGFCFSATAVVIGWKRLLA